MSKTSGLPHEWPFVLFDPSEFQVPERKIKRVFLHNTGWDSMVFTGPDLVTEINRWHLAEGWSGIGFHFIVDKQGYITTGRPMDNAPVIEHGKGNTKTIAIAVQGLWHFTEREMQSVQVLCWKMNEAFDLEGKGITFHGLCEIAKVPSPMFDYHYLLNLSETGHMIKSPELSRAREVADRASFFMPVGGEA